MKTINELIEDLQKEESVIFTPEQIELIFRETYFSVCGLVGILCDSEYEED